MSSSIQRKSLLTLTGTSKKTIIAIRDQEVTGAVAAVASRDGVVMIVIGYHRTGRRGDVVVAEIVAVGAGKGGGIVEEIVMVVGGGTAGVGPEASPEIEGGLGPEVGPKIEAEVGLGGVDREIGEVDLGVGLGVAAVNVTVDQGGAEVENGERGRKRAANIRDIPKITNTQSIIRQMLMSVTLKGTHQTLVATLKVMMTPIYPPRRPIQRTRYLTEIPQLPPNLPLLMVGLVCTLT